MLALWCEDMILSTLQTRELKISEILMLFVIFVTVVGVNR